MGLSVVFEVWLLRAIGRGRPWAFPLLALLALGWSFGPIHRGDAFYVVSNGLTFAYCLLRLALGIVSRRPVGPAIVSE